MKVFLFFVLVLFGASSVVRAQADKDYSWEQAQALFNQAWPLTKQELNAEQIFVGRCTKSRSLESQAGLVVFNAKKRVFFDFNHSNPSHWLTMSDANLGQAVGEIRKSGTFQRMKDISGDIGLYFRDNDNKNLLRMRKTVENSRDIFVVEMATEITVYRPAFYPYQICWMEVRS